MKLLIDANILLDVLQQRAPHYKYSSIVWKLCETAQVEGYVSVLTFMNMTYILRKHLTPQKIEELYNTLSLIFTFTDLTQKDVASAAELRLKDFEDAAQIKTAERIGADYIITRNIKDFNDCSIPAFTPEDFVKFKILNQQ